MNRRFDLAVALGAIFLVIFIVTTTILMSVGVFERTPDSAPAPVGEAVSPRALPPQARSADPWIDRRGERPGGFRAPDPVQPRLEWRDDRTYGYGGMPDSGTTFEGYRFRPLEERELSRLEAPSTPRDGPTMERSYGWPGAESRQWWGNGVGRGDPGLEDPVFRRDPRLPDDVTSDWGTTPYRFRPTEPQRGEPDSRRPMPPSRAPRGFMAPGLFEPPPQWGATPLEPPARWPELYPSLVSPNDRRLTLGIH
jgi:hypothetical protein